MNWAHFIGEQLWVERLGWTLLHFLWQGALIGALYAAIRRWLSASSPNARYILGCAALAAMVAAPLVTFALMGPSEVIQPTAHLARVPVGALTNGAGGSVLESVTFGSSIAGHENILTWVVVVWLAGALLCWARLMGGWVVAARMRTVSVRPAPPEWQNILSKLRATIGLSRPVQLLVSARVQVPIVLGWLRPVVLVPIGALTGLPAEQMEALLIHELAHIRRHDYLINILQSVSEALLFYHPVVWWVSGHIRTERELCCDDVAVSVSGDVLIYAHALAELESCRPTHLSAAIGANGASLANRIARLLGESRPASRIRPGFSVLVSAILLVITAYGLFGQSPATRPTFDAFEVATIKPSDPNVKGRFIRMQSAHQLVAKNESLKALIEFAYNVASQQISGGPAWLNLDRYDILAKTLGDVRPNHDEQMAMLRALLADRFKLSFHHEQKDMPIYALTVARDGPKLKESTVSLDATPEGPRPLIFVGYPGRVRLPGRYATMAELASVLQLGAVNRPVIDKTGLSGRYDFDLAFTPDETQVGGAWGSATAESVEPDLFAAIQQQLGLRLEATKGPVDVLVIDRAERPSEN